MMSIPPGSVSAFWTGHCRLTVSTPIIMVPKLNYWLRWGAGFRIACPDFGNGEKAITGEYLFQLGLFQAAKDMNADAHQSFGKSLEILRAVLKQYPDSLGAFILEESANALYQGADSIYMKDIDGIRKRFPNRLLEIEMIRRLKPHSLVKQIKKIQIENEYNIDFDLDSLVNEMEKQQKL